MKAIRKFQRLNKGINTSFWKKKMLCKQPVRSESLKLLSRSFQRWILQFKRLDLRRLTLENGKNNFNTKQINSLSKYLELKTEDCCYSKPLSVLACGVGDPRNVLLSLCNLSETYEEELTFVLNDICACTLARTVLILYILFKGKCCPSRYLCQ